MEERRTGLLPEILVVDWPPIDAQHEHLFLSIESLKAACVGVSCLPIDDFGQLLDELERHFGYEEKLAAQVGVEFSQHISVHRDNLLSLRDALEVVASGISDAYSFLRYLEFWFERHIIQYDQAFIDELQRKKVIPEFDFPGNAELNSESSAA